MKQFQLLAGWALGLLLLGGACVPAKTASPGGPTLDHGKIVFLDGPVTIDGAPARLNQMVTATSVLATGPDAACELVFAERNIIKVGANSLLQLDFTKDIREIQLQQGAVTSVLKKLPKLTGQADSFRIRTPATTAGVRGTAFFVKVTGPQTYLCTCNGTVTAESGASLPDQTLQAPHHTARLFTKTGDQVAVTNSTLLDHTDADMEALASQINYQIDWTKPD